jgi:hypothetical protein
MRHFGPCCAATLLKFKVANAERYFRGGLGAMLIPKGAIPKGSMPMTVSKSTASKSLRMPVQAASMVLASCLFAALGASLIVQRAAAASPNKHQPALHRVHHAYPAAHLYAFAPPAALPHRPEYGFLNYVPPNAVRMPGYTFVPGVGILGESCDLPTSACSNEYRDVQ